MLLKEYLYEEAEYGDISEATARKLFDIMLEEYIRLMQEDKDFYKEVEWICLKRKYKSIHCPYFYSVVKKMVKAGNIRRMYAERYPDEYPMSEV